jgi:lysophospholipase L1-like esterase
MFDVSAAPVLRVMPVGDSITEGIPIPGGYRAPLYQLMTNAGYNLDFIGTQSDNSVASLPDPNHEGNGGYTIDQVAAEIPGWAELIDDPDVILLLIGTNDYGDSDDTPEAIERLDLLISELAEVWPKARIMVANLLLRTEDPEADVAIQQTFNPYVPGVVANHAALGQLVSFLDMRSALGASDLSDGLHPNQTGYNKMATNWFSAISEIIAPNQTNGQLVSFDGSSLDGSLNLAAIPNTYQPIPGLTIGYDGVGIFNGGPDISGITGGNHYSTYSIDGGSPQVFTFSEPVAIPSLWLSTYVGGASGTSLNVTVSAYSDIGGTLLLTNATVTTGAHPVGSNLVWTQFQGLADISTNIMCVEFSSDGDAQVDDMVLDVATNLGPVEAVHLSLLTTNLLSKNDYLMETNVSDDYLSINNATNLYANDYYPEQATVTADYLYAGNVSVTARMGVVYSSSDSNVVTVTASGAVQAVGIGSAIITATLGTASNSLSVTVLPGALVDFNAGLANLGASVPIPSSYQPVAGVTIGYTSVELINTGPDHTTGIPGNNRYNAGQNGIPQVYTFSAPVSIPSVWLTTLNGAGASITITAYADTNGTTVLGTSLFATPEHLSSDYIWAQCTNLNSGTYNGMIRRISFSSRGNAQLDDMLVIPHVSLTTTVDAGNIIVSWPISSPGKTLMSSTGIGVNASWTPVGNSAVLVGANHVVTIPISGTAQFFRLQ